MSTVLELEHLARLDDLVAKLQTIETTEDGREALRSEQAFITGRDK